MAGYWSTTQDHLRLADAACSKTRCTGLSRFVNCQPTDYSKAGLMIVAAGYLGNDANDAPAAALSGLDCTLVHVNRWLQETSETHSTTDLRWTKSLVVARCIGAAPDTLLEDELGQSILREMDIETPSVEDGGEKRHWTENIGRQLAADACVTVLLVGIDRLLDWPLDARARAAIDRLPDNVRIIATITSSTSDRLSQQTGVVSPGWTSIDQDSSLSMQQQQQKQQQDQTSINNLLPVAWTRELVDNGLGPFFDRLEELYTTPLVRSVASVLTQASGRFHCGGLTFNQLQHRSSVDSPSDDDLLSPSVSDVADVRHQLLAALVESLDPLLIRTTTAASVAASTITSDPGALMMWSWPGLIYARSRYSFKMEQEQINGQFKATEDDCAIRFMARLLTPPPASSMDGQMRRNWLTETLFDWRTWLVAAESPLAYRLLEAAVRYSAVAWLDSQLWLMADNLEWIASRADHQGAHQLAPQLAAALKPFAEKESSEHNRHLCQLYHSAQSYCDQFSGPILVAPATGWNWNHRSAPTQRLLDVETEGNIRLMTLSPDGQTLVMAVDNSGSNVVVSNNYDSLYSANASSGRRLASYRGHSGLVTCIQVTSDGLQLISGSEDTTVIVWQLHSGQLLLRIREHIAAVACVSCIMPNRLVVSGGEDSILMAVQWPGKGDRLVRIDHHRGPVTSLVTNSRQDVLVSGSHDGSCCIWSLDDWSLLNVVAVGHPVGHVALSSDDTFLLTVGSEENGGLPRLFSLTTGSALRAWNDLPGKVVCSGGAVVAGGIHHSLAALPASDGRLMCYDCHSGQLVHLFQQNGTASASAACCTKAADPRLIFHSVGRKVSVWLLRYEERRPPSVTSGAVSWLAISPTDGSVVAAGDRSGFVTLWRTSQLSKIGQWSHPASSITVVSFDPSGLYVASGAEDGSVSVWHLDAGQTLPACQVHPTGRAISQLVMDGRSGSYAWSCDVAESIFQWRLNSGEVLRHWPSAASRILVVSKNGRWMAGSTGSNSVRLWALESNGFDENSGKEPMTTVSHAEEVLCMTLTSDSRNLITGSKDSSLKMWELLAENRTAKLVQILAGHADHVTAVASAFQQTPSTLSNSSGCLSSVPSSPSPIPIASKQLMVVSGSRDGQLIVWDAQHGSEIHSIKLHRSAVTAIRLSADGSVFVSGCKDGIVHVCSVKSGTSLSSLSLASAIRQIVIAPDVAKVWVRLDQLSHAAVLDLRHTPAVLVKPEPTPASRPASPVNVKKAPPTRRLLKKEISLDSYTWLKRYGPKSSSNSFVQQQQQQQHQTAAPAVVHQPAPAIPSPTAVSSSSSSEKLFKKLSRRNSICNLPENSSDS